jgi:DNA-binding transcriptional ArsR family regulator
MADDVLILEPGDVRAQKIAKAMASQTAGDILRILADGERSLTDITDGLSIPLTTAKYHIGNLLEAGIIEIADTRYSVKGKEMKLYRVANKLLIVAPRAVSARELLLKYASLFGIVTAATVALAELVPLLGSRQLPERAPAAFSSAAPDAMALRTMAAANEGGAAAVSTASDLAFAFFLGGCLVIFLLFCYELHLWRKLKR